ncbi:MAG: hypothetical protein ACI38Q_06490 [Candidatus Bruticola sp.]
MEEHQLSFALIGESENFISWGTLLARKGFTLSGIYLPQRWAALASVLLLGCPAYASLEETASSGDILFIEKSLLAQLPAEQKSKILNPGRQSSKEIAENQNERVAVLIDFVRELPETGVDKAEEQSSEISELMSLIVDSETDFSRRCYLLKVSGPLSEAGRDILRVDEVCNGRAHEPNPCRDYTFDCCGLRLLLKSMEAEESDCDGVRSV